MTEFTTTNRLGVKLIALVDLNKLRIYEAQAIKIIKKTEEVPLSIHKEYRHQKGKYELGHKVGPNPASAFEPHTSEKDLELKKTAKIVSDYLEKKTIESKYQELIIIAEPKLLGHLKQKFSKHLKDIISKEIAKDLAHQEMKEIERSVFG